MIVLNQTFIMALLILLGIICFKVNLITKEVNKSLSGIVLKIVNPVMIFVSYQKDFDMNLLHGLLQSFLLATIFYVVSIVISNLVLKSSDKGNQAIERFSAIYSNCGFMGIPLVYGIYGNDGVFYLTAFITIFNIFAWTHGIFIMKSDGSKFSFKSLIKVLKSPALIGIFLGLLCFLLRISLPSTILQTLTYIADLNTPLAMIVAGATIAQTNLISAFKNFRIYIVSILKLIIFPVLMIFLYKVFNYDTLIVGTIILALSCPTATMCTLFAIEYNKNSVYASEIFAVTTILSIATLPLIMMLFNVLN